LAEITDCLMDSCNKVRKLTRVQLMVGNVFADDLSRQKRMVFVGVHHRHPEEIVLHLYMMTPINTKGLLPVRSEECPQLAGAWGAIGWASSMQGQR
jgi:hypothetical protein